MNKKVQPVFDLLQPITYINLGVWAVTAHSPLEGNLAAEAGVGHTVYIQEGLYQVNRLVGK